MTRVKICGLTRADDALAAAAAGADYLGFVFVPSSPRAIDAAAARSIVEAVRAGGHRPQFVGVFRDADPDVVTATARAAELDLIQLHGNEEDHAIESLPLPVIRAIPVADRPPVIASQSARFLLFDSHDAQRGGGTGRTFDWRLLADVAVTRPFFLAGGITPENVWEAIRTVKPFAVDVSSGVEIAPGRKDGLRLTSLIERVRQS